MEDMVINTAFAALAVILLMLVLIGYFIMKAEHEMMAALCRVTSEEIAPREDEYEGLEGVQRLAYDPQTWPHCMPVSDSSRHGG